jgi:hypothetical protein
MSKYDEWWVEATIKVKYLFKGENYKTPEDVISVEEGELELMLDKEEVNDFYTQNKLVRFDEVEVVEMKATKKEGVKK